MQSSLSSPTRPLDIAEARADPPGDALGDSLDKQKSVLNDVANQYPAPKMVLSHSVIDSAVDATWYGVSRLRDAGYQMVAVDTCLGNSGMSLCRFLLRACTGTVDKAKLTRQASGLTSTLASPSSPTTAGGVRWFIRPGLSVLDNVSERILAHL